ncbi:c-di-GMP-binding flagellar brake protein YcgR, contains PilZNR and PilZ domains [Balnearium lithotrophicum]|uniref:C-di-GMP-binding flagellar brake protein YcgR, contains PilZNR and PilZ domains n=1 Tax=Balnearium lithotrophicum TaxID=223788 RepID=A0A521C689_9BACT|nr:PilZ domain-containing protein [Balnearium lithotrophicum]SMO54914.1 c-di-GMP-binding flagellar brake protein YcgR, contains PilZNR and PilZ domains [Balnearium lithotrophicum]
MNRLGFLKFPSANITTVITFIIVVLSFIIFFILLGFLREYIKKKRLKEYFFREAIERGLTEEEVEILWKYSLEMGRDPFLSIEFKAPFEKVVDLYLKSDPQADENLVKDMRTKLGFDFVPSFVPIVSTKDIDLFQTGKLYTEENKPYEVSLFDKDEYFMYWAVIDDKRIPNVKGEKITISFIRKGDGIYKIEGEVVDSYFENGKQILKIPHTFEFTRYQRREYARVDVELPVEVGIPIKDGLTWIKGEIVDISAGGAKVCISLEDYPNEIKPLTKLELKFKLENRNFHVVSEVVNIYSYRYSTCYGVKFENLTPEEQKFIQDFVKREQQKLAELSTKLRG